MDKKKGYIIYLDVLGYKNIIKEKSEEDIERLRHYIGLFSKQFISERASAYYDNYEEKKLVFNCYSDNFLIFYESDEIDYESFGISLLFASHMCCEAIINGFLLRGSIVFGELEYNENVVFGRTIVEAYELEDSHVEPNIALSKELKLFYQDNKMYLENFLSPFVMANISDKYGVKQIYKGIEILVKRLNAQPLIDDKTMIKYKWIVDEFNRYFSPLYFLYMDIYPSFIEITLSENI